MSNRIFLWKIFQGPMEFMFNYRFWLEIEKMRDITTINLNQIILIPLRYSENICSLEVIRKMDITNLSQKKKNSIR